MKRIALIAVALVAATVPSAVASAAGVDDAAGMVMAGVYSGEWDSSADLDALAAVTGKRVSLAGSFHNPFESEGANWDRNTEWILEEAWQAGATPFANLEVSVSAATIASGGYDTPLRTWAGRVKGWLDRGGGRAMFLAPLQEMNGDWVPYGMDPANFRTAYRRIVEIFRSMGMDETKVRWVFAPNGWSTPPHRIVDYYPGADVVDMIGISTYNFGTTIDRWQTVYETMGGAVAELRSFAADKPFLISQVGSSSFGGDRDAWLREMFAFTASDPNVVGFIYFNLDRETDWRVWTGSSVAAGWRDGMQQAGTVYRFPLADWFQPGPLPNGDSTPSSPTMPLPDGFCSADAPHPDPGFADVASGSWFDASVAWLAHSEITSGYPDGTYRPEAPVSRAEAATFLWSLSCRPTGAAPTGFWDVPASSWFADQVAWLTATGLTSGFPDGGYHPAGTVTRAQMAMFLWRLAGSAAAGSAAFADVPDGAWFEAAVGWLVAEGISSGRTQTTFAPNDPVTRAELAVLLDRFAATR